MFDQWYWAQVLIKNRVISTHFPVPVPVRLLQHRTCITICSYTRAKRHLLLDGLSEPPKPPTAPLYVGGVRCTHLIDPALSALVRRVEHN